MKWINAQIEERKHHNLTKDEGVKHYAKSYENYFHFCGIDNNIKNKLIAEIGPAQRHRDHFRTTGVQGLPHCFMGRKLRMMI
jgi:hypothetical protein